jgi:6,7-dimethyl-8-ribityllumazine synthase
VWKVYRENCEKFITVDEFKELFENANAILRYLENHGITMLGAVICRGTKRVHFIVSETSKAINAITLSIWTTEID